MRGWYRPADLLGIDGEHVIPQHWSMQESIAYIASTASLPQASILSGSP
jgi:hypothetical protein